MSNRLFIGGGHNLQMVMTPANPLPEPVTVDNIDHNPLCKPSILHDLDETPWPIPDEEYDEAHAYEVLEHLGGQGDWRSFFRTFNEIWRILKPGGALYGSTPSWDNLWAFGDPSHTRIINEGTLAFLQMREPKPPASDFRSVIKGWWKIEGAQHMQGRFFFHLIKEEANNAHV
jgi:SAM-dependent methyltransferase